MPTIPPYDTVTTVINAAKVRMNDRVNTLAAISGQLLDNTQFFTQQATNSAWRKLQEFLAEHKYQGLSQDVPFSNVPASSVSDPAIPNFFDYNGFFDGTTYSTGFALPQGMIRPYFLWERIHAVSPTNLLEMEEVQAPGLPGISPSLWNRIWRWQGDKLYVPGVIENWDCRINYAGLIVDFNDIASGPGANQVVGPWFVQPVPIMRCLDAFADYLCREVSVARQDTEGAAMFQASAERNALLIVNRDSAQPKSIMKSSEYGKMQDRFTPNMGGDTQPVKR